MSQKAPRKAVVSDDKEKRQTISPVKEMKKKMAANAEKEKQAAEKTVEKPEKPAEKTEKPAEKVEKEKSLEKKVDKSDKKTETVTEKKTDNGTEKRTEAASNKEDKTAKPEKPEQKAQKSKQNGNARVNGASNGTEHNGTVSAPDDDDELDEDEMFPELAYDSSDPEFEPDALPRSLTRRSQSKDSKVLKLKEDVPSTDRKLRSSDSPKPPEPKKAENAQESAKKTPETQEKVPEPSKKSQESPSKAEKETKDNENKEEKENSKTLEVVVVVEDIDDEPRKTDTNFSKSRVKVSPYRRSLRLADQTTSSVMANYTGNNTTMEMDITETSSFVSEEPSLDDSAYLSGLRSIRGRRSYKPLKEMALRHVTASKARAANASVSASASEQPSRPTGTVVGRKRKPESDSSIELGTDASSLLNTHGKRMRLLDRLFRRGDVAAEIVGINTDLPLTAPGASEGFDPESLKPARGPDPETAAMPEPCPGPGPGPGPALDRDSKRCLIM